jgi:hypothetical protein
MLIPNPLTKCEKAAHKKFLTKKSFEKWSFQALFIPLGGKQILKCFRSFSESKNANLQEMLNIYFMFRILFSNFFTIDLSSC